MCLVIMSGVRDMYKIETGIDVDAIGDSTDPDYFKNNRKKGQIYL